MHSGCFKFPASTSRLLLELKGHIHRILVNSVLLDPLVYIYISYSSDQTLKHFTNMVTLKRQST